MTESIPSILTDDTYAPAEPSELDAPPVSSVLVDHLRRAFPQRLPSLGDCPSAEVVLAQVALLQGQAEVVAYLEALVHTQNGDARELSRTQAPEDQSSSSRSPTARRRG